MSKSLRGSLLAGIVLVLGGAFLLAAQLVPALKFWEGWGLSWPAFIVGAGAFMLIFGLLVGAPGMAVPAAIVAGVGGILWYQNATGNWTSWAYAWTLIPGFVGVGVLVSELLQGRLRQALPGVAWLLLISLGLFTLFSLSFGLRLMQTYWPVLVIVFGLMVLLEALRPRRKTTQPDK